MILHEMCYIPGIWVYILRIIMSLMGMTCDYEIYIQAWIFRQNYNFTMNTSWCTLLEWASVCSGSSIEYQEDMGLAYLSPKTTWHHGSLNLLALCSWIYRNLFFIPFEKYIGSSLWGLYIEFHSSMPLYT